jgi:hypothetical protein
MGTVGTIIEQYIAMHTPSKKTGIQGMIYDYRSEALVSMNIITK